MRACCNKRAACVATHFTVNDATHLDGSYHVLLQQTYTPGWVVVVAVNIDAEGCCSHSLVSGEVRMVEVQGDANDVSVTCRGVIAGCHHHSGQ